MIASACAQLATVNDNDRGILHMVCAHPNHRGHSLGYAASLAVLECIIRDEDPVINVEWGLHITELMYATLESARTGSRYCMTTQLPHDW